MKSYQVTMNYVSSFTVTVSAPDAEYAIELAEMEGLRREIRNNAELKDSSVEEVPS